MCHHFSEYIYFNYRGFTVYLKLYNSYIKLTFDSNKCNNVTKTSSCSISVIGTSLRNSCANLVLSFLTKDKFTDKSHSTP